MKAIDYAKPIIELLGTMPESIELLTSENISTIERACIDLWKAIFVDAESIIRQRSKNPSNDVVLGVLREQNLKYKSVCCTVNTVKPYTILNENGFEKQCKKDMGVDI